MSKKIVKNRAEAVKWANGGRVNDQREAFWKENGTAYRAERNPGNAACSINDASGLWWNGKTTVIKKLG